MKIKLNKFILEDIQTKDHPNDFIKLKKYSILILKLPIIKKSEIFEKSKSFLIKDKKIYIYEIDNQEFKELGNFDDFYKYIDKIIDKILIKINSFNQKINKIEDELFDNKDIDLNEWLNLKKKLSLLERNFSSLEIPFELFIKTYKKEIDEFAYFDLKEHITRIHKHSTSLLKKLDYIYNFYRTKVDEKTNKIMLILTIMSAIFMPLTLISGFFGMNTGGLPFTTTNNGTFNVLLIMILFEIPFLIFIIYLTKK